MENLVSMLDFMPLGYRFCPTDEELVNHYLNNKLLGKNFLVEIIPEIDVCKHEPWDIPAFSVIQSEDEWFFFSPRVYKYSNSRRSERSTERGFWKPTGRDREIKLRGTDSVIGTKKTLVFHEGRVPRGIKREWVIHEYNAITFPPDQRTFVLCRLMKKPEKKAEDGTPEIVCDEGELRVPVASDYENQDMIPDVHPANLRSIFHITQADENDMDFIRQSPISIEHEFSPIPNFWVGNDNSSGHFETTEEEDNAFVNSLLTEELFSEERTHAFVNGPSQSESLRMVYYESSDTDAEVLSARVKYGNIPDTSTVSSNKANREKKGGFFQDDFDTSSSDSTAARSLEINCIEIASSPSTLRTCKTQYQPRSANSVSQRAGGRRSQTQRKVPAKGAYHHEAQKETLVESSSNQRKAQVTISRNILEARSNQSSDVNGRGSFIHLETPSLSQNPSPPSVYLVNVIVGLFLFIGIVWEILSCGRFC